MEINNKNKEKLGDIKKKYTHLRQIYILFYKQKHVAGSCENGISSSVQFTFILVEEKGLDDPHCQL